VIRTSLRVGEILNSAYFKVIQEDGMKLRIGGAESVKENNSISLHKRSDVKNVDLDERSALVSMTSQND
jgi:hypothetical protein